MRAQRIIVANVGGLPCISRPILNTLPANHTVAAEATRPSTIDSTTCQNGGGVPDARRAIMPNPLNGGIRLIATLIGEFGARLKLVKKTNGTTSSSRSEERRVGKECRSRWSADR